MRSHISRRGEVFLIRVWKLLPNRRILKPLRESLKRTISDNGGLGLLQRAYMFILCSTKSFHFFVIMFILCISLSVEYNDCTKLLYIGC